MPVATDARGALSAIESGKDLPFEMRRVFFMYGTPEGVERGGHAHRDTQQVVLAISGRFKMDLSDGTATRTFDLHDRKLGLYMPPMTWTRLYDFSADAVGVVFADTHYDRARSLRSWDDFARAVREAQARPT